MNATLLRQLEFLVLMDRIKSSLYNILMTCIDWVCLSFFAFFMVYPCFYFQHLMSGDRPSRDEGYLLRNDDDKRVLKHQEKPYSNESIHGRILRLRWISDLRFDG